MLQTNPPAHFTMILMWSISSSLGNGLWARCFLELLMSETAEKKPARRKGPRPIGDLVLAELDPITRARGFAGAELIARWPEIAGERLAKHSRPLALKWPARGEKSDPEQLKGASTLEIAVAPSHALDLQYAAPQLIERLNAMFGWRCVEKLRLLQRPVAQKQVRSSAPGPLTRTEQEVLEQSLQKIDDPDCVRPCSALEMASFDV